MFKNATRNLQNPFYVLPFPSGRQTFRSQRVAVAGEAQQPASVPTERACASFSNSSYQSNSVHLHLLFLLVRRPWEEEDAGGGGGTAPGGGMNAGGSASGTWKAGGEGALLVCLGGGGKLDMFSIFASFPCADVDVSLVFLFNFVKSPSCDSKFDSSAICCFLCASQEFQPVSRPYYSTYSRTRHC